MYSLPLKIEEEIAANRFTIEAANLYNAAEKLVSATIDNRFDMMLSLVESSKKFDNALNHYVEVREK